MMHLKCLRHRLFYSILNLWFCLVTGFMNQVWKSSNKWHWRGNQTEGIIMVFHHDFNNWSFMLNIFSSIDFFLPLFQLLLMVILTEHTPHIWKPFTISLIVFFFSVLLPWFFICRPQGMIKASMKPERYLFIPNWHWIIIFLLLKIAKSRSCTTVRKLILVHCT